MLLLRIIHIGSASYLVGSSLYGYYLSLVPTIRLDSWLKALWISRIDYLKIDTQGADFAVLRSAGDRLQDIRRIKLEVAVTPTPLYQGAASKDQIVRYLAGRGFALIAEQPQTHGQEENLGFFRIGPAAEDARPFHLDRLDVKESDLKKLAQSLPDDRLLSLARAVAELRPLEYYPGWYFSRADALDDPTVQFRKVIWQTCHERKLQKPLVFPWYHGRKLHLYLGNDMSRPTFIGGCIEPNEFVFMNSFLQAGMVMLDIGANDGSFTVFASERVVASVATMICFAFIDPLLVRNDDYPPPAFASRMTSYALGFFFFWLISALSSLLTLYLARTARPEPPATDEPGDRTRSVP